MNESVSPSGDEHPAATETPHHAASPNEAAPEQVTADLDRIEQDLADVETALSRLDQGTYFTDEVTGEPIAEALLEHEPLARRNR